MQSTLNGKQSVITVQSTTNQSKSVTAESVTAITNITLSAGTWLVIGGCQFPAGSVSAVTDIKKNMVCINTSTTFNHDNAQDVTSPNGMTMNLNTHALITITSSTIVYLLCYSAYAGTVTRGRIYALKIG